MYVCIFYIYIYIFQIYPYIVTAHMLLIDNTYMYFYIVMILIIIPFMARNPCGQSTQHPNFLVIQDGNKRPNIVKQA